MKVSDTYGSRFVRAADIPKGGTAGQIVEVGLEMIKGGDGQTKRRIVLGIDGLDKPLVVNATNAHRLAEAFGDDAEDWPGQGVKVDTKPVQFGGKIVPGICVTPLDSSNGDGG